MKDLNELLQAILDMDAAQRKATAEASDDQKKRLGELAGQKQEIAQECAGAAKAEAEKNTAARQQQNSAAINELADKEKAAAAQLEKAVAENKNRWADELCRRALAR